MFGGVGNWAKIDIHRDSKGVWNDSPGTLVCTEAPEGADQNRSWDMTKALCRMPEISRAMRDVENNTQLLPLQFWS